MAIQDASAALTASSGLLCLRGFLFYQEGDLNTTSGNIEAQPDYYSWSSLEGSSWAEWTSFTATVKPIKWTAPMIDLGSDVSFNIEITCTTNGSNSFFIHTSTTGDFAGEETEYFVQENDLDISSFSGRYVYVTVVSTGTQMSRFSVTTSIETISFVIRNVDTSTLAGTSTARQIPITRPISGITDIIIQPRAASSYAVNLYVSDTATSEVVIPVVKSKSSTPTFALYGIDNDPRDSIVDIQISALPRMACIGGGIIVIQ